MSAAAHSGGPSAPDSTQAACRAAPSATYSPGVGSSTGRPRMAGAIRATASERAAPPTRNARCTGTPAATSASSASASPHEQPLDGGPGQVRRGGAGQRQPVQGAGGVRPVGRALTLQVGHQHQAVGARRRGQREPGQLRVVDAEDARRRVEHPGRVQRAHQGQVLAGGRGEPGDDAGRVGGRDVADRGDHARGAQRDRPRRPGRRPGRARRPRCPRRPARGPARPGCARRARRVRAPAAAARRSGRRRVRAGRAGTRR